MAKDIKGGVSPEIDPALKKDLEKHDQMSLENKYKSLADQIKVEYKLAWDHQKPKKDEALLRLKLYNNQKRDKKAVGDTTLFTIHQTVLASLYTDRLSAVWEGREEGDDEVAENLNALSQYDYDHMGKDEEDYFWIWDACFFGRGILALHEFERNPDKGIFLPIPETIDPVSFLRDPRAISINGGQRSRGSARFMGRSIMMSKHEMKNHPHFMDSEVDKLKFGEDIKSTLRDAQEARDTAQGRQYQKDQKEAKLGANAEYHLLEWYTHWNDEGTVKKVKVWLGNQQNLVVGYQVIKSEIWPLFDRPLYPHSHDWDGTSIPDLTGDKQRARAVAQNLGLDAMKADLYPMYIYDDNKITNKNDLNFAFNKFIPADSPDGNTLFPLRKAFPNLPLIDFIYNSLDVSAQKATATPEIQQGAVSEEQRTLGEINLVASKVDTRYSLSAKIFGWSEKRFWRQWYYLYKEHFAEDVDEKVLRLEGAFGAKWRPLGKKDIITNLDPDVCIESQVLSRAKQLEERQSLTNYFSLALAEPTANRRYGLKKLGKVFGLEKDEIDRLFPPTVDERIAEDENDRLNQNEFVEVLSEDDHNLHLEMHAKARETNATTAHIEAHKMALMIKRVNPELFPQEEDEAGLQQFQPGQSPAPGQRQEIRPPNPRDAVGQAVQ